ncbi:MAG: YlxR family protein [Chloroflexi bacterium]|nr:YlxR family protein [Chloroflexota bacterium]
MTRSKPRPAVQRACVACRQARDKREMVRIVRTPAGAVEIDAGGRKAGRGAYLCPAPVCWDAALKGSRLEHALRGSLSPQDRQDILRYFREIRGD